MLLRRHDVVAGFQRRQHRGGDRRHAGRGRAAGLGAFERDHALLEHRNRRIGVARIDVAGVLSLEARLAQLGSLVDIALREEQTLGCLAEFGTQRAGMHQPGFGTIAGERRELGHVTSHAPLYPGHKKTGLGNSSRPGSQSSPACLAIYLTWLQAGRLKSPRDKSCSYSPPTFPSRRPSDKALKGLILRDK